MGLIAVALLAAPELAQAQFTQVDVGLADGLLGHAVWDDFDSDGDLDILTGGGDVDSVAVVNENNAGAFVSTLEAPGPFRGDVAWGDYNNDGNPDFVFTGKISGIFITNVYENLGSHFSPIGAGLPQMRNGTAAWGDYDNDGDLDLLLAGADGFASLSTEIYENDGGVFTPIGANLLGIRFGDVAWGDHDDDGDLDIVVLGQDLFGAPVTEVYENNGGVFSAIPSGLPGVMFGNAAWGDYDNDGDLDLLLSGQGQFGIVFSEVYENNWGVFAPISAGLFGVRFSDGAWGDYDSDGDLDIALTGEDPFGAAVTEVYENNAGAFTPVAAGLHPVRKGTVGWGDYDNDGDPDILLAGEKPDTSWLTGVWRNDLASNEAPEADAGGPYTVECRDAADGNSSILLDGSGSFDADGDALAFAWSAGAGTFDNASLAQPTLDVTGIAPGTVVNVTLMVDDGEESDLAATTVEVVDTWAPDIDCPDDIVQAPTSPAGNTVTYTPTATDACDADPEVVSNPPSGSQFPAGTTTVVTVTATDDAGNSSACTFTVRILSVDQLLESLVNDTETLGINKGSKTKLLKLLENVRRLHAVGKTKPACVGLQVVANEVDKLVARGELDAATGRALADSTDDLCALLGS